MFSGSRLRILLVAALAEACAPMPSLPPTESASPAPSPTAIEISCTPDAQAPAYLGDPCPAATVAVELAVAPVRLPLARVIIQPGPFFCDDVWPGAGVEAPCYAPMVQPGQFMHAWVSFAKSSEIAAVMVGRDLPTEVGSPRPAPPRWTATLITVEVPPAGWAMP